MVALWDQIGVPHKGWIDLGVFDEQFPDHICQMCRSAHVRFVHVMRHPDYPEDLHVGCVCAERMSSDFVTPRGHEKAAKNRKARRDKWVQRKWRTSRKGHAYIRAQGVLFTVMMHPAGWNYSLMKLASGTGHWGPGGFPSSDAAKLAAFDARWPAFAIPERNL